MSKYQCSVCGHIYDEVVGEEQSGIAANTSWENVPESYSCPLCGVGKDSFVKI